MVNVNLDICVLNNRAIHCHLFIVNNPGNIELWVTFVVNVSFVFIVDTMCFNFCRLHLTRTK